MLLPAPGGWHSRLYNDNDAARGLAHARERQEAGHRAGLEVQP